MYVVLELKDETPVGPAEIYNADRLDPAIDSVVDRVMESYDKNDGDPDTYRSRIREIIVESGQYEIGNWKIMVFMGDAV